MPTLKDIAKLLVQKHELKQRDAETFMTAFVDTVLEGLKSDRQVKIKGFGTFKVTAVRERESINVNTGERVVISGHDKISFTPDAVMRDIVNKPFAQFETVVLADGVDFEDMSEGVVENDEEASAAEAHYEVESPQEEVQEPLIIPMSSNDGRIGESAPEAVPPVGDSTEQATSVEKPVEEETLPKVLPIAKDDAVSDMREETESEAREETESEAQEETESEAREETESEAREETESEAREETESEAREETIDEAREEVLPEPQVEAEPKEKLDSVSGEDAVMPERPKEERHHRKSHHRHRNEEQDDCRKLFIVYAIVANIIFASIAFVLGYLCAANNWLGLNNTSDTTSVMPAEYIDGGHPIDKSSQAAVCDSVERKRSRGDTDKGVAMDEKTAQKPDSAVTASAKEKTAQAVQGGKPAVPAESTSPRKLPEPVNSGKYDSDPRVRTGAYTIVGTATTVKVRAGQTLKSISKAYLGEGMECYVEVFNGGIKEVSEGQTIKIPELQLKNRKKR